MFDKKETNWQEFLAVEKEKNYFKNIMNFIDSEKNKGKIIFPSSKDIFSIFSFCELKDISVVIVGQDPYHNENEAHGLAFSVHPVIKIPLSLKSIYKELVDDVGINMPQSGFLKPWAKQGVFLLNTILTVEKGKPNSHKNIGWQEFTDNLIELIAKNNDNVVFMLWGANAKSKHNIIDKSKKHHLILESVHPSPLSAYRGFFGCRHFSKCNKYLSENNYKQINWQI